MVVKVKLELRCEEGRANSARRMWTRQRERTESSILLVALDRGKHFAESSRGVKVSAVL